MKLHTTLTVSQVYGALDTAHQKGNVAPDVHFVQFKPEGSNSRPNGFKIQLGTYDKTSGPTNSRHYKNSGSSGATSEWVRGEAVWAATYDEWGWFIAEIFAQDPDATFGQYKGLDDFNRQTDDKYILTEEA